MFKQNGLGFFANRWLKAGLLAAAILGLLVVLGLAALFFQTPAGLTAAQWGNWLFAADQEQVTWYITRSAGITAYLLLWVSTAWGLALSGKVLDGKLHAAFTFDFHQFISLLSIGLVGIHLAALMVDRYLPYTLAQILIPGLSTYRPVWVGIGSLAFPLILLVTITFYLRKRIGMRAFRAIHWLSLAAFLGAAVHGLMAGTDSSLRSMQGLYAGSFLSVVFLLSYRLLTMKTKVLKRVATN
jgi:predicted ferric reductase